MNELTTKLCRKVSPKSSARFSTSWSKYVADFGCAPTYREIAEAFDLSSPASIHQYMKVLEEKGYVSMNHNESRSIELTSKSLPVPQAVNLPLAGLITAGVPIEAVENKEMIGVPVSLVDDPANSYVLRVKGESMIEDGILDGDYVIVERNQAPAMEISCRLAR